MKVRYGRLWLVFALCCFILLAISVATSGFRALGASEIGHKPQKNPKLSTLLVLLSHGVKQESARPAVPGVISPPAGFSIDALPKPLRDAIDTRQMHVTNDGEVQVYIELTTIEPQILDELRTYGVTVQIVGKPQPDKSKGEVLATVPTVQGMLPVTMIGQVSALAFVRYIRLPDYGFTNTGSVDSQGDQVLQAAQARAQFGVDGTGIRVGVISDGIGGIFDPSSCGLSIEVPNPIQTGDLPNATPTCAKGVLISVSGGITAQSFPSSAPNLEPLSPDTTSGVAAEGTAMMEIVHDLAPGAQLYFANAADGTCMSFEQAVDFLALNTDVVVDDLSCLTPPFDGTSAVSTNTATELNTDTNRIRGYFTAVANFAQDHYEGQYLDSGMDGTSITGQTGHLHMFQAVKGVTVDNAGFGSSIFDPLAVPAGGVVKVLLAWNDPNGASTNDYDLFLVPLSCPNGFSVTLPRPSCTISGPPVGLSIDSQTGAQDPTEVVAYQNPTNSPVALGIVIQNVNNTATSRTFDMFIGGALADLPIPDHNFNTVSGSVPAESDAGGSPVSVVSVGAIDQTQCSGVGNSRMKPDVTATDDVSVTGAGGFGMNGSNATATGRCLQGSPSPPGCYFAGTSAAAPHAAAIAALVLQALSSSTVGQSPATQRANLRNFLTSTAVPLPGISEPVPNNIEGFGLLDAVAAVKAAGGTVTSGDFNLSSNPASLSIAAPGQSGSSTITVTGTNGFTGTVSFTCSISPLPANSPPTCFASPSSIALSATTTTATANLRISTTAGLNSELLPGNRWNKSGYFAASMGLVLASIFLLGVPRQRKQWAASLGLLALVFLGVALSSCASGSGGSSRINFGTPAGSYTVTFTASGGGTAQTTNVAVTVQ